MVALASRDYPLDVRDDTWDVPVPGVMNVGCGAPVSVSRVILTP